MLIVPEGVVLKDGQQIAGQEIVTWGNDDNAEEKTWCLYGAPGTGKSFLTDIILKNLRRGPIAVTAPTHKAKRVIAQFTKSVGAKEFTLHALLGLRPDMDLDNFDINNVIFAPKNEPQLPMFRFLVIDECSMINKDLLEYLDQQARASRCKILFIGDKCQLPPVKEDISPTFTYVGGTSVLMEPVRQNADNPIMLLLQALRSEIEPTEYQRGLLFQMIDEHYPQLEQVKTMRNGYFEYIIRKQSACLNSSGLGYVSTDNMSEFLEEVDRFFKAPELDDNINFAKFITYTNENVSEWNKYIRKVKFGAEDQETDDLFVGDLLMAYSSIYGADAEPIITNSQDYIVTYVSDDIISEWLRVDGENIQVDIPVWAITICPADAKSKLFGTTMYVVKPDGYHNFLRAHAYFLNGGRKFKQWKAYYQFKNKFLLLGNKFANAMKHMKKDDIPTKDIDYAFAITTHKSQGSTYSNVFVNYKNISSAKDHYGEDKDRSQAYTYMLRMLYVAISRAKERVFIYK